MIYKRAPPYMLMRCRSRGLRYAKMVMLERRRRWLVDERVRRSRSTSATWGPDERYPEGC
jgi:hypothetical protein